ncbi:hypothetical protein F5Y03DRAFT_241164 [Xylaria venustula]|nr:hypothetical protein F5Y03DRAFT_241164 [Xylaria venustula]
MATSNSPPAPDSQTRKRRGRNSDVRKEQNRIASRAYREKRRQKLALLDEILKSDNHNDSMSSVSDETEYNSTPPAAELRTIDTNCRARNSSHSPAPYYMSAIPALPPVPSGVQTLPSNGPNCDTDAYVGYSVVKDYVQEAERLGTHAHNPNISAIGMSTGYVSPLPPISPMPSTPMFPFDEEFMGDPYSAYPPIPDGSMHGFPAPTSGYDSNMMHALESLSRLDDNQQQQVVAYLQKRRNAMHSTATAHALELGYGTYQIPRSSPLPGHLQNSEDTAQRDYRLP